MSCRHVEIIIHIGWSDADMEIPATVPKRPII